MTKFERLLDDIKYKLDEIENEYNSLLIEKEELERIV